MFFIKLSLPDGLPVLINPKMIVGVIGKESAEGTRRETNTILMIQGFKDIQILETKEQVEKMFNTWKLRGSIRSVAAGDGDE